jgi:DNA repair protein RadC
MNPKHSNTPTSQRSNLPTLQDVTQLSNADLLGSLLNNKNLGKIIAEGTDLWSLYKTPASALTNIHGVSQARAHKIKAAIELGLRLTQQQPDKLPLVDSPHVAARIFGLYEMSALEQEHMRVALLNTRNRAFHVYDAYVGSLNSAMIRPGELFKEAIRRNAAAIIIAHNHPSGDMNPSVEDVNLTKIVAQAGNLLDISLLDHIIIGNGQYVSIKENLGTSIFSH